MGDIRAENDKVEISKSTVKPLNEEDQVEKSKDQGKMSFFSEMQMKTQSVDSLEMLHQ